MIHVRNGIALMRRGKRFMSIDAIYEARHAHYI